MNQPPNMDDEEAGRILTRVLSQVARRIPVADRWSSIEAGLPSTTTMPLISVDSLRAARRRRRALALAAVAAVVLVVVVGVRRQLIGTPQPAAPPGLRSAPRTLTEANMVVYRSNVSEEEQPVGSLYIEPELMVSDSLDLGVAAVEALFDTHPAQPSGVLDWSHLGQPDPTKNHDWTHWQQVDVTSVTNSGGFIRIELNGFSAHLGASDAAAAVMVQAWVYTVQDTLRSRNEVLITLQGEPFLLYGEFDTAKPFKRDDRVQIRDFAGFDQPKDGDVIGSNFKLLGHIDAAPSRPARLRLINLDTGQTVDDQEFSHSTGKLGGLRQPRSGRYQARLDGVDADGKPYSEQVTFTVVV